MPSVPEIKLAGIDDDFFVAKLFSGSHYSAANVTIDLKNTSEVYVNFCKTTSFVLLLLVISASLHPFPIIQILL